MLEQAVCTIITKSYLAHARTLAGTLAEHNPEVKLFVLLADRVDDYFEPNLEPFNVVHLEDLSNQELVERMCFYYTPFELCCALRGMLHEYMFDKTFAHSWLFLDSDVMIFNSLDIIFKELNNTSILLNPHCTTPIDSKYIDPHEINFLRSGLYNAGFLGLRRTDVSQAFISWFKERLTNFCFNDYSNGEFALRSLFVDQLWLNLAPLYFRDVSFCLEPGVNLGHWSLFERELGKDDLGNITVNEQPLFFIHFSGWDINNTDKVSKYAPIYERETPALWIELSEAYRKTLLKNGYEKFISCPYAFNYFQSGDLITSTIRRIYYDDLTKKIAFEDSPFVNHSYFKSRVDRDKHKKANSFIRRFGKCLVGSFTKFHQ